MTASVLARAPAPVPVLPRSLRAALLSLWSFEALLALYLFAGLYKGDPRFDWITLDPTGLFFALSVISGTLILVTRPLFWPGLYPVIACLALVTWFALSLLWSPSQVYGPDKVFYMATLVLWGLIAGAIIVAPDRTRLRRLFMVLVLASLIAALEAVSVYLEAGGGPLRVASANYIALGRLCGLGAVIVFVAWLFSRQRFGPYGLACLGLFGLFGFVLLVSGGRGPLIATVASLLPTVLVGVRTSGYGLRLARYQLPALALGLLAAGALTVWLAASEQTPETLQRLGQLTGDRGPGQLGADPDPILSGSTRVLGPGAPARPRCRQLAAAGRPARSAALSPQPVCRGGGGGRPRGPRPAGGPAAGRAAAGLDRQGARRPPVDVRADAVHQRVPERDGERRYPGQPGAVSPDRDADRVRAAAAGARVPPGPAPDPRTRRGARRRVRLRARPGAGCGGRRAHLSAPCGARRSRTVPAGRGQPSVSAGVLGLEGAGASEPAKIFDGEKCRVFAIVEFGAAYFLESVLDQLGFEGQGNPTSTDVASCQASQL